MAEVQPVLERGVMATPDLLAMISGSRHYGAKSLTAAMVYEQPLPEGFQALADEIHTSLELPKLDIGATRDQMYAAYAADIKFLDAKRAGFVAFAKMGIRASMIQRKISSSFDAMTKVEEEWKALEATIPLAGHAPLIRLSADDAALPDGFLRDHLVKEAQAGVGRLLKLVGYWFDVLVAREFFGLVEFTSEHAGRYFYFRPEITIEVEKGDGVARVIGYDASAPYGERTTYETKSGHKTTTTTRLERHQHDIVNARKHSVEDYPERMPERVCDFLRDMPTWLRRHVEVISGTITLESVRRRVANVEEVGEVTRSVTKGSPAIALGPYVPVGWSSDDLQRESFSYFCSQKIAAPFRSTRKRKMLRNVVGTAILVSVYAGGIWYLVHSSHEASVAAYQSYVAEHATRRKIYTVTRAEHTVLPKGVPLYYLGITSVMGSNNGGIVLSTDVDSAWKMYPDQTGYNHGNQQTLALDEDGPDTRYGTVDLGPTLGIPAKMNVLYRDKGQVRFTLDYYTKTNK